jgi:CubicO group peptidase (beta-lactamase class C family)
MRSKAILLYVFIFIFQISVAEVPDSILTKLAELVKDYDNPEEPGYAFAVIKDQEIIFKHAGGLANMEYGIPLTTKSVFNIASISKQFTAASIAILSLEGKISLEDPVTTFLPELPDIYKTVRIKHMIHMESGIRDFYILHHLRGRGENVYSTTVGETLELLAMQKSLYFQPGDRYDYSNTNYLLLAEIVKRISGKSLREFTNERIFKPLGMADTHFHDDRTEIVKNRASAYFLGEFSEIFIYRDILSDTENIRKGFKIAPESFVFDLVGQSQLYTTVEDLFLWDRNFYTGEVGGQELLDLLLTRSTFNHGETNNYAFALVHGKYGPAGLKTVSHSGGTNGYLSNYIRFPEEEFSIIFMTNNTGIDDSVIDRAIQICLEDQLNSVQRGLKIEQEAVSFQKKKFDAYQGIYELLPEFTLTFAREEDQYFVTIADQEKMEIFPSSDTTFFLKMVDAQISFHTDKEEPCNELTWHQEGERYSASRIPDTEQKVIDPQKYTGFYYSDELDVIYEVYLNDEQLFLRYKPYFPIFTKPLKPVRKDIFHAEAMWKVEFERNDLGKMNNMVLISPVGIGKIRFSKVQSGK